MPERSEDVRLPDVTPDVALLIVGRALADAYSGTVEEPLPDALVEVLRRLERPENSIARMPAARGLIMTSPSRRVARQRGRMRSWRLRPAREGRERPACDAPGTRSSRAPRARRRSTRSGPRCRPRASGSTTPEVRTAEFRLRNPRASVPLLWREDVKRRWIKIVRLETVEFYENRCLDPHPACLSRSTGVSGSCRRTALVLSGVLRRHPFSRFPNVRLSSTTARVRQPFTAWDLLAVAGRASFGRTRSRTL